MVAAVGVVVLIAVRHAEIPQADGVIEGCQFEDVAVVAVFGE